MSVLIPHAEEPTHEEFVEIWLTSRSALQTSERLAELGYVEMTPGVCMDWFRTLRALGVRLTPFKQPSIHIDVANSVFLQAVAC